MLLLALLSPPTGWGAQEGLWPQLRFRVSSHTLHPRSELPALFHTLAARAAWCSWRKVPGETRTPPPKLGLAVFTALGGVFLHSREEKREWGHLGPQQGWSPPVLNHRDAGAPAQAALGCPRVEVEGGSERRGVPC